MKQVRKVLILRLMLPNLALIHQWKENTSEYRWTRITQLEEIIMEDLIFGQKKANKTGGK